MKERPDTHSAFILVLIPLIQNETLKLLRRRRFAIVCGIMFVILVLVSYSQYRQLRQMKNANWRADLQERIARAENRLRRGQINESWARSMRAEIRRLQFYLDRGINPEQPTAPLVVRTFANAAGLLLLPLLIAVLGSDIVSAENAEGTDKLLLTRPVRRWKILTAKLITLWLFASLTLLVGGAASRMSSPRPCCPRGGWDVPMFNGFQFSRRDVQDRVGAPAPAVAGRADRIRAGVVRAAGRRLDLADAVRDLQIVAPRRSGRCSPR